MTTDKMYFCGSVLSEELQLSLGPERACDLSSRLVCLSCSC